MQGERREFESFTADIPDFLDYVGRQIISEKSDGWLKWMLRIRNSW